MGIEHGGSIKTLTVEPNEKGNVVEIKLNINVHGSNEKKVALGSL